MKTLSEAIKSALAVDTEAAQNPPTTRVRRLFCPRQYHSAKPDVFYYIASFYNRRRRHSALDYLSLEAYEQLFCQQELTFA